MEKQDGGPAFPGCVSADNQGGLNHGDPGMTIRDWFAGQALAGYLAGTKDFIESADAAKWSYRYADAMLAARGR